MERIRASLLILIIVAAGFLECPIQALAAGSPAIPIADFYQVSNGIYRGARPNKIGLDALAKLGVKTVLNIDNDRSAIADEAKNAKKIGLRIISIPLSGFWSPEDRKIEKILSVFADSSNYPIYVHCKYGHDRTGLVVGLFRVFFEKWAPRAAYAEMKALGFHPELVFLNHYFKETTERRGSSLQE